MEHRTLRINHHSMLKFLPQLLECPICRELMYPPIRECVQGHNFCDSCFDQISICAVCRQPKAKGQNFALEEVSRSLTIDCSNRSKGCTFKGIFTIVDDHERMCPAASLYCPESLDCAEKITVGDMMEHCQNFHPEKMLYSNEMNIVHLNYFDLYSTFFRKIPFTFGTQTILKHRFWLFRPYCRIDSQDISWHISYIGPQCFPERCWFNLKLITPGKKLVPLIMHKVCKPLPIDYTRSFEFEHKIRHSSLRPFCCNGNLYFKLEIYEKE
ncbi:uncharacterized protein LOC123674860 [Harmonia axyridis]|uniref:uncharacterized protein LOC123674860 n=1 Tax=Harmonia axyridis TaxID=115357 RepID=UPI001E2753DC|nr:uncharacterized protein LOC123674860 [Harmonia axyridis]